MKKIVWTILGLAIVGFIGYRVIVSIQAKQAVNAQAGTAKVTPVDVMSPVMSTIVDRLLQTGTISAQSEVTLYSKVAGKLEKNLVELNDNIKSGRMVALVDRDEVGYSYNQYEVKSNAEGTIARVFQNPGAVISPNTPLYLVVNVDIVKAVIAVPESQIRHIRSRHPATVTAQAYPDQKFTGMVTNISPVANPVSRTIEVEISVANARHLLKPGMFIQAELILQKRNAMIIPLAAVTEREGQQVVFIARDSMAAVQPIATGSAMRDSVEIVSGLKLSDRVIVSGTHLLNDKDRIKLASQ